MTCCKICGKSFVESDLIVEVLRVPVVTMTDPEHVHLRCLRPAARTEPPVPPLLTDEDLE